MKRFTALIKTERNGVITHMVHEGYTRKKKFKEDLRANGYRVLMILTDEEIREIQENPLTDLLKGVSVRVWEYIKQVL